MKKLGLLVLLLSLVLVSGCSCTNAANARRALGECTVTVYGFDAKPIKSYETSGRPVSEDHSDGWYFVNKATDKTVILSGGTIIIEEK